MVQHEQENGYNYYKHTANLFGLTLGGFKTLRTNKCGCQGFVSYLCQRLTGFRYRASTEAEGISKMNRLTRKVKPDKEWMIINRILDNKEIAQRKHPSKWMKYLMDG